MPSLFSFLSKPETESLPSKLPKYHSNPEWVPCSRLSLIYLAWLSTEMSRAHKLLIFFSLIITNVFCISIMNTTHKKNAASHPTLAWSLFLLVRGCSRVVSLYSWLLLLCSFIVEASVVKFHRVDIKSEKR